MSKSAVDSLITTILTTADKHLPNTPENADTWLDMFELLFETVKDGGKLREIQLTTLGDGPVNVGYPGMTRNSPTKTIMQERKILIARGPTTAISYHLAWIDANDKSKGFELVRFTSDRDPGERYPIR